MNTKEKNSQSIILITGIMRAILILTIVTSYIAMISYLVFYANYYRSIGAMIFYIPLILFSLCPILFFSNKYAVMGIVFSLLIYLYFYSNSFYSSTGLTIPFLQQQSVIHILFYIGLLLYLFYFSLFIAVVFINVINQARQNGDIKKMLLQMFFIIYIFLVIIVILVIMVTSNSLGGWL